MGYMDAKEEDEEEGEDYWGDLLQGRNPLHFLFYFKKVLTF